MNSIAATFLHAVAENDDKCNLYFFFLDSAQVVLLFAMCDCKQVNSLKADHNKKNFLTDITLLLEQCNNKWHVLVLLKMGTQTPISIDKSGCLCAHCYVVCQYSTDNVYWILHSVAG